MGIPIIVPFVSEAAFSWAGIGGLASLASYQAARLDNSSTKYGSALVSVKITTGSSAPTAGLCYRVHLLRQPGTLKDDNFGTSAGSITIINAPVLGEIQVTNSANTAFQRIFDTAPLGPLGPYWTIALSNQTDQALHSTDANTIAYVHYNYPELNT